MSCGLPAKPEREVPSGGEAGADSMRAPAILTIRRLPGGAAAAAWAMLLGAALLLVGVPTTARAQASGPPAGPPSLYGVFRYDEDYRYLADPTRRSGFLDPLKYIPLDENPDTYLSLGGELRERFEYYSSTDFSTGGRPVNAYLLHRILLHADLHVTDAFRAFVQIGNHLSAGKDEPLSPVHEDRLDLQQGFVDVRVPVTGEVDPLLRAGRQEMGFGSQRFVSIRDAPNVRRSFDGLRLSEAIGSVTIDAFLTRPTQLKTGTFDDQPNHGQAFWGIYATMPASLIPALQLDLYYFGFDNKAARFGTVAGGEHRHTVGVRLFGATAGWDWNWEVAGQLGRFADQDIRAWTVASDTGYTLGNLPWTPRLGIKANIASGDGNPHDHTLGTLDPLFPKLAYFSQAALGAPSNFYDFQPSVTVRATQELAISVNWDFFWRETTQDAIYKANFVPVAGTAGRRGKPIGNEASLDLTWQVDRHIQFQASYAHFNIGDALKRAGGKDVDFGAVSVGYRF